MSFMSNSTSKSSLLAAVLLATAPMGSVAHAAATPVEVTPELQTAIISKQQAESIALRAVGGGTVLLAVLERENHLIHWSVDITGATAEYEVWVSTSGKVLKIIKQPL